MLVLSRRVGEGLMIGESVSVIVLGVEGSQVRIGIQAPKEVAVHRQEVFRRIQRGATTACKASRVPAEVATFSRQGT